MQENEGDLSVAVTATLGATLEGEQSITNGEIERQKEKKGKDDAQEPKPMITSEYLVTNAVHANFQFCPLPEEKGRARF